MTFMNSFFQCLGFGFLSILPLVGQDAENDKPRQVGGRVACFVYTSIPEGLENPVSVMSGKEVSQLLLSKLSPSDPVRIPADGILRIVRPLDNPKDPNKPEYLTIAQAVVPETVADAVIILMPAAKNSNGLLFQTKVQDLASFKSGDTMFLNMTNLKIGVELGKEKIQIDPGQTNIHNPLGTAKSVSLPIRLSYYQPDRKEWSMITASTVALYSTRRELCIFNWDARFNRVDFESITISASQ